MHIDSIFDNNKRWAEEKTSSDPDYFVNLAKGQRPEILYIGCSDSRVTAEDMMGAQPGDLFVHRNIANVVANTDINAMAVINYAVAHLEVKHLVVCGHYGCGGVAAAMKPQDLGALNPWLRNIRDVYRLNRDELDAIDDEAARYRRFVEVNVQEQCINVLKAPEVQEAFQSGKLNVHAWVFDIATGRITDLRADIARLADDLRQIFWLT